VSGLDLSRESPGDIVVTLRSLPRRFREALADADDIDDADAQDRVRGHVADTARALADLSQALDAVLAGRTPASAAAPTPPADLDRELTRLADEATALADKVQRVSGDEWHRIDRALELARDAVRVGIDGLHATERAVASASGT
jgi:hypothetical protein